MVMNIPGKQVVQKAVLSHGMFTSKFRDFGTCYLMLDKIPPVISGLKSKTNLTSAAQINIVVTDNYNKIKYFSSKLNNNNKYLNNKYWRLINNCKMKKK